MAESRGVESSENGGVQSLKRRREPALDAESPSSCIIPVTKRRTLFKDPATPTNTRRVSVLLPNNTKLLLSSPLVSRIASLEEFLNSIRSEAEKVVEQGPKKRKRQVRWGPNVFLEDSLGYPISNVETLKKLLQRSHATILVQVYLLHCPVCCLLN